MTNKLPFDSTFEPALVKEMQQYGEIKNFKEGDIIMLDEKTALVSWMEGAVLKAAKVHTDGTKEPSIIIASSSASRSSGFPQMTKSGNTIIFAWTDDKLKKISTVSLAL